MSTKSLSIGVKNLQKEISNKISYNNNKQFIPFVQQRRLGKLIDQNIE